MSEAAPRPAPGALVWLLLGAAALAAAAIGIAFAGPTLLEAWLLTVVLLTGLAVGSLGLLMIGHLLGGEWLHPIRDELQPASWTLPLVLILAAPVVAGFDLLYPLEGAGARLTELRRDYFARDALLIRAAVCFAVWIGLAILVTRRGEHRAASAVGLALLAPTVTLAGVDWVLTRSPFWLSTLFGFAFAVSQLLAALALAFLVNLAQGEHPNPVRFRSLSSALLSLALLTFWVWFVQYLVAWQANLPTEAAWYEVRTDGFGWLVAVALAALLAGILLLVPFDRGRWRLVGASALILIHHVAHMTWLIRPVAPRSTLGWPDIIIPAGLGALWLAFLVAGVRYYDSRHPDEAGKQQRRQPGRPGSSYQGRSGGTSGGQTISPSAPSV